MYKTTFCHIRKLFLSDEFPALRRLRCVEAGESVQLNPRLVPDEVVGQVPAVLEVLTAVDEHLLIQRDALRLLEAIV